MLALALSQDELVEQAINDLLNGTLPSSLSVDISNATAIKVGTDVKSDSFKKFLDILPTYSAWTDTFFKLSVMYHSSKNLIELLKNDPNHFTKEERAKIFSLYSSSSESIELLKARVFINEKERSQLAKGYLAFYVADHKDKKEFLTTDLSNEEERELFYQSIVKQQFPTEKADQAKLYLECFPNISAERRKELFGYLQTNANRLVNFIKNNPITEEERLSALKSISEGSKYDVFKHIGNLDSIFKNKQEKDNFLKENKNKLLDWGLNKTFKDLNKKLNGKFEQGDIDYILEKIRNSNSWSPDFVKGLIEALNKGLIDIPAKISLELEKTARIKIIDMGINKSFEDTYKKLNEKLEERDIYYIFAIVSDTKKWSTKFVDDMLSAHDKGLINIPKSVYDKLNTTSITKKLLEN